MVRALKVFSTPAGFFTAVVAAPSQKAALEAWGVRDNLFATGAAVVVTDPDLVAQALAQPGRIVRAPLAEIPVAAPPATPPAKVAPRPSPPPPDRRPLEAAEAALADASRRRSDALAKLEAERAAFEAREARTHAECDARVAAATATLERAQEIYDVALAASAR